MLLPLLIIFGLVAKERGIEEALAWAHTTAMLSLLFMLISIAIIVGAIVI